MILACHNIEKAFGEEVIVSGGSFHIEEREKAAESETETASESESTDGGSKSDGNAEKGQFEVESESKSAAGNEASDTADDAEEVKHTLTFVIYE